MIIQKKCDEPNFYVSEPYLILHKVFCFKQNNWVWCEGDGWCIFPPVFMGTENETSVCPVELDIWCDWEGYSHNTYAKQVFDYEYIFCPESFTRMIGGKWETFRKNSKKWARNNPNHVVTMHEPTISSKSNLILNWIESHQLLVDGDFIIDYLLQKKNKGINFQYVYKGAELVGINAWDINWKYINYRMCIASPNEHYLNEYLRWNFYTYIAKTKCYIGYKVNDGGTLGDKGIEKFKDKLQPDKKRIRYSHININKNEN